jgi:hypothetical protein
MPVAQERQGTCWRCGKLHHNESLADHHASGMREVASEPAQQYSFVLNVHYGEPRKILTCIWDGIEMRMSASSNAAGSPSGKEW